MTRGATRGSRLLQPLVSVTKIGTQMQVAVERQADGDPDPGFREGTATGAGAGNPLPLSETPMDADKEAIYRHPLFPLLALLFEKCERSTRGSESVTSASFDVDIDNFVRGQEKEGQAFFCDDPELDNLMVKAIQVLRIHLLELEKVSDLCEDFRGRYIACLRTKMSGEALLSGDPGGPCSPARTQTSPSFTGTLSPRAIAVPASARQPGTVTVTTVDPTRVVAGAAVYQPVAVVTPQALSSPGTIHIQNTQLQLQLNQDLSFFSHDDGSPKNKRGVLPKPATDVMRTWLFQHIGHPYPTEEEKKLIATQTNLTLLQVNNWFINARRRILQPMMEAISAEAPKAKKKTPQNRPLQRFWPDSIAAAGAMADGAAATASTDAPSSDGATPAAQRAKTGRHSEDESGESGEELSTADTAGAGPAYR